MRVSADTLKSARLNASRKNAHAAASSYGTSIRLVIKFRTKSGTRVHGFEKSNAKLSFKKGAQ